VAQSGIDNRPSQARPGWLPESVAGWDRVTWAALILSVLGWSLIWDEQLGLFSWLPGWVGFALFGCGLALIPFRGRWRRGP